MSIKSDSRHLYLQVIEYIKKEIENGTYKEKEKLPSEFELSKQLGISRATLREALRLLEEEGVLIRRHGVGTFVNSKPKFSSGIEELFSITDMIKRSGQTPGTIFVSSLSRDADDEEMARFKFKEKGQVLHIERVRTADKVPVVYCLDSIPRKILADDDLYDHESLLDMLETKAGKYVAYAVTHIEPLGYHEKISPILECGLETGLLVLKQMHYDENDEPILYSVNYFRADKFSFHVLRKRV